MTEPSTVAKMDYRGKPPPRPHHTSRSLVTTDQEGDSVDWTDTEEEADEDVNLSQDDVTPYFGCHHTHGTSPQHRRDDPFMESVHRAVCDVRLCSSGQ